VVINSNTMKKTGQVIFVIGLIMTALAGFDLVTREKIIDIGRIEITAQKRHVFDWSPLLGLSVMAVGAGVYLFARKSRSYINVTK
jgi:hypothetical protein